MSSDMLVHWYSRYRVEKAKIRARQRVELERELEPIAVELGRAIAAERSAGKRIEDIGNLMGLKNKTFIYAMLESFKKSNESETPAQPLPAIPAPDVPSYDFEFHGDTVLVKIEDYEYTVQLENGEVIATPEEWLTHSKDKRKLYAQIIREIEDAAAA